MCPWGSADLFQLLRPFFLPSLRPSFSLFLLIGTARVLEGILPSLGGGRGAPPSAHQILQRWKSREKDRGGDLFGWAREEPFSSAYQVQGAFTQVEGRGAF
jgi:hypothetical protein